MKNKETLEEAAERLYPINSTRGDMEMLSRHQLNNCSKQEGFIEGAKWQAESMYSEEEVLSLLNNFDKHIIELKKFKLGNRFDVKWWFEQFKKKS